MNGANSPLSLANFERTDAQLEYFFLRCVMVAGKNAGQQQKKLDLVLGANKSEPTKFLFSLDGKSILSLLKGAKTGQYSRISRAIAHMKYHKMGGPKLREMTLKELEAIPGIGPKTARFFVAYSREGQQVAVLDTHILAWLREQGHKAPRNTPSSGDAYSKWETVFLWECQSRNRTPVELDDEIWKTRRKRDAKSLRKHPVRQR